MKHLKIYFAVLFFSFLGSTQNQLFAQAEPTKNIGSSAQTLNAGEYMENGDFRAKLQKGITQDDGSANIVIYKASDNSVVRKLSLHRNPNWENFKLIGFDTSNESEIWFIYSYNGDWQGPAGTRKLANISKSGREACVSGGWKVLSSGRDVEATKSAYFQLEADGKFVIYSGTGGVPILEYSSL